MSRRADREGVARAGVGTAITLRYAHAFQFAERICGRGRRREDAAALQPRLF